MASPEQVSSQSGQGAVTNLKSAAFDLQQSLIGGITKLHQDPKMPHKLFKASRFLVKFHNLFITSQLLFGALLYWDSVLPLKANKNLDMSINASNNFNLNITWSVGSTGTFTWFS